MDECQEEFCPRIPLTDTMKQEAEFYIFNSALRGLREERYIDFYDFKNLAGYDPEILESYFNQLPTSTQSRSSELLSIKRRGLHGEIAFHLSRKSDYHIAFEVAMSYIYLRIGSLDGGFEYPSTLPDACLDPSVSVINRCSGSKTIDVKTEGRKKSNEYVGLSIKNTKWKQWQRSNSYDAFYVAISERQRKNRPYDVLNYAILGYAFKDEIDATIPRYGKKIDSKRGYRFIHFYDLHPIDLLTPSSYQTSVTVRDRMLEAGYDV